MKRLSIGFILIFQLSIFCYAQITVKPATVPVTGRIATAEELFLGRGAFVIRTMLDYRYLTIKNDLSKSSVVKAFNWGGEPQLWNFISQPGGYYKIKSTTGLCLQIGGTSIFYATSKPEAATDAQLWQLEEVDGWLYRIKSKSGKYLGVSGGVREGIPIAFANSNTGANEQKWQLVKMTEDGRKITAFAPNVHGFKFANTFEGVDNSYRYGGLCGGMVYTALDYYRNSKPIPPQTYRPANRTPLQSYIYDRQHKSVWEDNLDKWTELRLNPFGARDAEFFEWGIRGYSGGRLEELRQELDKNIPVPLGMYEGGTAGIDGRKGGDHQVMALGYAMGRYTGNLQGHTEDMKIFVYNPNNPFDVLTLVPDLAKKCFYEVETGMCWRTYFVNKKYTPKMPLEISALAANEPDGSIRHIYASFRTGGDDLRGGNDNVHLTVNFRDGSSQTFSNVNGQARWVDNYVETVPLLLNRPVAKADIREFVITTTFGGGIGGDNWNLDNFWVDNGGNIQLACANCADGARFPFFRFTGDAKTVRVPIR